MREACLAWVYVRDIVFGAEWFVYIAAIGDADIFSGIEVELRAALYHAKSLATDFAELKVIYPASSLPIVSFSGTASICKPRGWAYSRARINSSTGTR